MAAPTVYSNVSEGANLGGRLFAGKNFWVAQRVPSRNRYLELIKSNGGEVVMLEKKADYLIADHCRKDSPPGSISFRFIEDSIDRGEIADPENHRAGPPVGTARDVGSVGRPTKGGRAAYTAEEDRILYKWVRDHEKQGGSASGNELYKQLEAEHPRHTWQSWRDRYLKQLRNRPPAGLNVPDNAPPSPPSDQSAEQMPRPRPASKEERNPAHNVESQPVTKIERERAGRASEGRVTEEYTVDDFDNLFAKEDWEELYANVEVIEETIFKDYLEGWGNWAKGTSQSAEQWKQYFEKVVRPQWLRDTPTKKKIIRKVVAKRHKDKKEDNEEEGKEEISRAEPDEEVTEEVEETVQPGSSSPKHTRKKPIAPPSSMDPRLLESYIEKFSRERKGRVPQEAYMFWAREKKHAVWAENPGFSYAEVHKTLNPRWNALSNGDKAPYYLMEAADKRRHEGESNAVPSSEMGTSTVAQGTPQYITKTHDKIMKRIRDEDPTDEFITEDEPSTKRRKSESPSLQEEIEQMDIIGTQQQPLGISSSVSSTLSEDVEEDVTDEALRNSLVENIEDIIQAELQTQETDEEIEVDDEDELDEADVRHPRLEPLPRPELPSNTPTPKASRQKASAFDTQAILSSPSQAPLSALPRPRQPRTVSPSSNVSVQASSPGAKADSIASTTHSLKDFRRSLNDPQETGQAAKPRTFAPLPHQDRTSSTTPFETDSQTSDDPDPPLTPRELDDFFSEQHEEGFEDEEITAALRHTRCRPELAVRVLDAWKDLKALPDRRGIWSREDDEDVESGDGLALAKLERKHSLDGWGGITERLRFLEQWRSRS